MLTLAATPLPTLTDPVYILCVLLIVMAIAPLIAKTLKIPNLVVLIILGTIIGTNVLGLLDRNVFGTADLAKNLIDAGLLKPEKKAELLKGLNQQSLLQGLEKIGLLYIMLIAGLQMNLQDLRKLGVRSLVFGLLTFGVPFTIGIISGQFLIAGGVLLASVLLGILYSPHTLVSYPIMARWGIVQQESVGVAVGGSVVTSVLTLVGLSLVQAFQSGKVDVQLFFKLGLLFPLLVVLIFWGMPKLASLILQPESDNLKEQFIFVLSCLFVVATGTLVLGIDSIVGAFIAGLALNQCIPITSKLMKQIDFVGNSFFIPAFLISVGVLCNPSIFFTKPENLGVAAVVIVGAVGGKFLAAWIAGLLFKYSFAEVMVIFSLTMSRAALVLVIALYGMNVNLINEGIFNAIIVYIVVTCLVGPFIADAFGRQVAKKTETPKLA
ncbi:MAG: cation:proton antiporter [Cyanosarcina radialis HA8281-LM2]|jgi:Kef-type K+ transport system membrane component KefB|nr:cation:proton antiporter [Cyanosarcina radialis HA8281-LM2]